MMESGRFASFRVLCLLAFLASGCAIEEPYRTETPHRSAPVTLPEAIQLLEAGISHEELFARVRIHGIASRPTTAEICALRQAGATEEFIAGILAAAILLPTEPSGGPEAELIPAWPPLHPFFGLWPFPGWVWKDGRWHPAPMFRPSPARVEPEP